MGKGADGLLTPWTQGEKLASLFPMKSFVSFLLITIILLFTGCNTIGGAGRDVSATGRGVTNGANAVKNSM